MSFKRKSKKVYKKKKCKVTRKKGKTRKRMTKRGGMKSTKSPKIRTNSNAKTSLENRIKTEEEEELERLEDSLESIRNQKLGIQSEEDIPICVIGPDYSQSPEYIALQTVYGARFEAEKKQKAIKGKATKGKAIAIDAPYEAFKNIEKMIRQRLGQVRCEAGPYRIFEFPRHKETYLLEQNIRLKFVVVKDENNKFMILMSYANMPNINYVEENLLKWTDNMPDGSIIPRTSIQGPKNVTEITSDIIKVIEQFCREKRISLRWDSLLMTRSIDSDSYNNIIQRYFRERMPPEELENTVFIMRIDEISHSALANNFRDKLIQKDENGIHLVYLGCEGVIYYKNGKLYFIICNLSGHFKTPAERMAYLRLILKYNYGYNEDEIRELIPDEPPQAQASNFDSDGSHDDDSRRPDFRRFITNDPDIQTFAQALIRLNQADITPRQGPVHTPYSQEVPI